VASGWSGPGRLQSRAGVGEEGEDFADGGFLAGGFGQREVRLDLVAVAAAVFVLDHVAGCGQVGDDAVGAALGDVQAGRDVAEPRVWVPTMPSPHATCEYSWIRPPSRSRRQTCMLSPAGARWALLSGGCWLRGRAYGARDAAQRPEAVAAGRCVRRARSLTEAAAQRMPSRPMTGAGPARAGRAMVSNGRAAIRAAACCPAWREQDMIGRKRNPWGLPGLGPGRVITARAGTRSAEFHTRRRQQWQ